MHGLGEAKCHGMYRSLLGMVRSGLDYGQPKSAMHAVSDIGALVEWLQDHITFGHDSADNLAVLHNQNHMVKEFGMSAWVAHSKKQVISRSVTSCAGVTAYMVIVAQTRVGFLTGGRGQKFRNLPEDERRTQEEEAYARATVALTRARKMCVIFCPLDMKGLLGAATVMGSLMYGAGHCWTGTVNMHLKSPSLEDCPEDEQFLCSFDQNDGQNGPMAQRRYPPVALAECVADIMFKRVVQATDSPKSLVARLLQPATSLSKHPARASARSRSLGVPLVLAYCKSGSLPTGRCVLCPAFVP